MTTQHPVLPMTNPSPGPRGRPKISRIPRGYSQAAAYLDSHEDAAVFRRFGNLKARVLLTMQAEIAAKEQKLKRIDLTEAITEEKNSFGDPDNCTWLRDKNEERKALIGEIAELLRKYENDVILYRQMRSLPKAEKWQARNFKRFLDYTQPIDRDELGFLDDMEDLVTTAPDELDSVRVWKPLERLFHGLIRPCGRIFESSTGKAMDDRQMFVVRAKPVMTMISRFLFAVLVAVVISAGVIAMYSCDTNYWRIVSLCVATLGLTMFTAIFTTARKSEVFGVAAAYCAVLVVFLGSVLDSPNTVSLEYEGKRINGTIIP